MKKTNNAIITNPLIPLLLLLLTLVTNSYEEDYYHQNREAILSITSNSQVELGKVENFVMKLPPPKLLIGADEEDGPPENDYSHMTHCPITGDGTDLTGTVEETLFFDFYLGLADDGDWTAEESYILKEAIKEYFNAYFNFACPDVNPVVHNIARLGVAQHDFQQTDKVIHKMVAVGKYQPPPRIAMDELIQDSIHNDGIRHSKTRRLIDLSYLPPKIAEILSKPFSQFLNETNAFKGKVVEVGVVEQTVVRCDSSAETCCGHLSYALDCSSHHNPASFCQLDCCCKFPEAPCCQNAFRTRHCTLQGYCFPHEITDSTPTAAPTWWEKKGNFFPERRKKSRVYIPQGYKLYENY